MTDGIEEIATIRTVSGIQNHTTAIAAPVSIEALGTRPSRRGRGDVGCTPIDPAFEYDGWCGGRDVGRDCNHAFNLGIPTAPDTAFPRELSGG